MKKYLLGKLDRIPPPVCTTWEEPETGAAAFPEPDECLLIFARVRGVRVEMAHQAH